MTSLRIAAAGWILVAAGAAGAQSAPDPRTSSSRYLYAFGGVSIIFLGSEDRRVGGGLGFGYGRPEPRFRYGSLRAQLVYEGYVDTTHGQDRKKNYLRDTFAVGGLAYGRWFVGRRLYADLGWGAQLANHASHDLPSVFNSTPVVGFGTLLPAGRYDWNIGLRLLHVSNAGTVGNNAGQNELFLTVGVRY